MSVAIYKSDPVATLHCGLPDDETVPKLNLL